MASTSFMRCLPNWTPWSKRSRDSLARSWHYPLPQTDLADISASKSRKIRRRYPDFVCVLVTHIITAHLMFTKIFHDYSHVLNQHIHSQTWNHSFRALLVFCQSQPLPDVPTFSSKMGQWGLPAPWHPVAPRNKGRGQENQRSASPVHQGVLRGTWTKPWKNTIGSTQNLASWKSSRKRLFHGSFHKWGYPQMDGL